MSPSLLIARREMRGGFQRFRIFLICLALGVAAIAAVGSVRTAVEQGLAQEGAAILGGDAELEFTYRFATDAERAWMASKAVEVSETVDFRSMAVIGSGESAESALVQVKAVDGAYPLYGAVQLAPNLPLSDALEMRDLPGAVAEQGLVDRLGLAIGDSFSLGSATFELRAILQRIPDTAGGFTFGPRVIVNTQALTGSGLIGPGTLFDTEYRLRLPERANLATLETEAERLFRDTGLRWRDSRNGAPGTARFVERIGAFLVLVGLAGLAVGGVGVSSAVRSFLDSKIETIATLKTLGATGNIIFVTYFIQIGIVSLIGVGFGLLLGGGVPVLLGPFFREALPVPALFAFYPKPLIEAAVYGLLTAAIFTLWPLARARDIRAAGLFRDIAAPERFLPRWQYLVAVCALSAVLIGVAAILSGVPRLALWTAFGILAALAILVLAAQLTIWISRHVANSPITRGRPALRLAFGAVGGPGSNARAVILSLGLGLTVLASVGQIDANMRQIITGELPDIAPSFFVVDINNEQKEPFLADIKAGGGINRIDTAPMLRGIITRINGASAVEVAGEHWVLRGDRGVTYGDTRPEGAVLTEGTWWPDGYSGPPLVSFAAEEGAELGLVIGDKITVNILGRDLTAEIANFREVDFGNMGINFIMTLNAAALAGAPHSHIATLYVAPEAEKGILRSIAKSYPNITAIQTREAIAQVADTFRKLAAATSWSAGVTLLTGFMVLIGAAASDERRRVFEAAILKTLGAVRGRILFSFALRSLITGAAAGFVAIGAGGIGAWAVITFVMDAEFAFAPVIAIVIVTTGALVNLAAGIAFAIRPLSARPARVLRARE